MIAFECPCDMGRHSAPIKGYEIQNGALRSLPVFLSGYRAVFAVADERTYKAAGKGVEKTLSDLGKLCGFHILKGDVLPNAQTLGDILIHLSCTAKPAKSGCSPLPDFILAVGSGTVNDCCRLVSYRLGLPYGVVGTAPSMDGYFSAGSPILFDGGKHTVQCTTPEFVVADLDIMSAAPYPMLIAGIGDMLGKYTGILDWELARDYKNEYFCEKIAADVISAADKCLDGAHGVLKRDSESVKSLMEGFAVTGLGMAFTHNSRPASGSEHIIAHAWELYDIENGNPPALHGLYVCEASRLVAAVFRRLLSETRDARLKSLITKYIRRFDAMDEFCKKANIPSPIKEKEAILFGIRKALTLRDRYTVLFYLRDNGLFEEYASRATEALLNEFRTGNI